MMMKMMHPKYLKTFFASFLQMCWCSKRQSSQRCTLFFFLPPFLLIFLPLKWPWHQKNYLDENALLPRKKLQNISQTIFRQTYHKLLCNFLTIIFPISMITFTRNRKQLLQNCHNAQFHRWKLLWLRKLPTNLTHFK